MYRMRTNYCIRTTERTLTFVIYTQDVALITWSLAVLRVQPTPAFMEKWLQVRKQTHSFKE